MPVPIRADAPPALTAALPAPLPATPWQPSKTPLPLLGEGVDEYGYPTRAVDGPRLRAIVAARQFNDVTAEIEELQSHVERDFRSEFLMVSALDAFAVDDPQYPLLLDEWVAAFPGSFAPYAARGAYWSGVAARRRGGNFIRETAKIDIDAMRDIHVRADTDLRQALAQRAGVAAVWRLRLGIAMHRGGTEALAEEALRGCPHCFAVRSRHLVSLEPRWGGSHAQQQAFIDESQKLVDKNPRLAVLRGYIDWDKCGTASHKDDIATALTHCDAAVAAGKSTLFFDRRGSVREKAKDWAGALDDAEAVLRLDPANAAAHLDRGRRLMVMKRIDEAVASFDEALRLDPFHKSNAGQIARNLVLVGHEHFRNGDHARAIAMYDRALQLDVTNADAIEWKTKAQKGATITDQVSELRKRYEEDPDDFQRVRDLDHALARLGRFPEIIPLWERYLARHPKDGRAYLERAGTNHHLKNRDAAIQDASRACELGEQKGCQLKARF